MEGIFYPLLLKEEKGFRQFLTRFSRSDWFLAMLKISTEHGSKVPVGKLFRKQKTTLNNIKRKVVLVIHGNYLMPLPGLTRKSMKHNFLKFLEINKFNS